MVRNKLCATEFARRTLAFASFEGVRVARYVHIKRPPKKLDSLPFSAEDLLDVTCPSSHHHGRASVPSSLVASLLQFHMLLRNPNRPWRNR